MSNKERPEIDETQEKTEEKSETSEKAANNLENSESYKGNETVPAPDESTESQHGDAGSKEKTQQNHQAKDNLQSFANEVKKFADKNVPLGGFAPSLKLNGNVGRPEEGHYTYRPYYGSDKGHIDIIEFNDDFVEGKVSPERIQASDNLERVRYFEKEQSDQTDASKEALEGKLQSFDKEQPETQEDANKLENSELVKGDKTKSAQEGNTGSQKETSDQKLQSSNKELPETQAHEKQDSTQEGTDVKKSEDNYQSVKKEITDKHIDKEERKTFDTIEQANIATESRGKSIWSRLHTVTGEHASFGRGQLTIQAHLEELRRLSDKQLEKIGLDRNNLNDMIERGRVVQRWFEVAVYGSQKAAKALGLTPEQIKRFNELAQKGEFDKIVNEFGERFSKSTGLPKEELRNYLWGRSLRDFIRNPKNRHEFQKTFQEVRQEIRQKRQKLQQQMKEIKSQIQTLRKKYQQKLRELQQERKNMTREEEYRRRRAEIRTGFLDQRRELIKQIRRINRQISELKKIPQREILKRTAERMRQNNEELGRILDGLDGRLSSMDVAYYLNNPGRFAENKAAAFTQGAKTSQYWNKFENALKNGLSDVADRMRSIRNYKQAKLAVGEISEFKNLSPTEQARILGTLARINHANPSMFRKTFLERDGNDWKPRFTSLKDLQKAINNLPSTYQIAIRNWQRNFDRITSN